MIITLDGLDGVGKSAVASLLGEKLNAKVIKGIRDVYVDKLAFESKHIDVRCLYYLASFLDSVLDSKLEARQIIIFDKSFYSTIVYHRLLGSQIDIEKTLTKIVSPDLKIYLTCQRSIWEERLRKRDKLDWYEEQILSNEDLSRKIELAYSELGLIRIENNELKNTVVEIMDIIKKLSGR
jgi:thymidylate kinase